MNSAQNDALGRELSRGEKVLWDGTPPVGLRIGSKDLVIIPFSLLWCGFTVFWEASVLRANVPLLFKLWGIPFVAMGLYMVVGRFFFDAWRRARTAYVLTEQRVMIFRGGSSPVVRSLSLNTLAEISVTETRGGRGTISFGSLPPFAVALMSSGLPIRPQGRALPPMLDEVQDVHGVAEMIRKAQIDARGA